MDWRVIRHGLIGAAVVGAIAHIGLCCATHEVRSSDEDPERARFMLECAYDWNVAPAECRRILEGDTPKPPPEDGH